MPPNTPLAIPPALLKGIAVLFAASSIYTGYSIATQRRLPGWMRAWLPGAADARPPAWLGLVWSAVGAASTLRALTQPDAPGLAGLPLGPPLQDCEAYDLAPTGVHGQVRISRHHVQRG